MTVDAEIGRPKPVKADRFVTAAIATVLLTVQAAWTSVLVWAGWQLLK